MYEMNLCERSYSAYKVGKDVNVCMYVCMYVCQPFPHRRELAKNLSCDPLPYSGDQSAEPFRSPYSIISYVCIMYVCMYVCTYICMNVYLCNQIYSRTWFGIFFHLPHIQLRIRCGRDGHLRGPPRAACASPRPARHHSTYGSAEPER